VDFVFVYQNFGCSRARIVVRRHAHAVGARRKQGQKIAFLDCKIACKANEIAGLADRADDVVTLCLG